MEIEEKQSLQTWEQLNQIKTYPNDEIFKYNENEHQQILKTKPWKQETEYFKTVYISSIALLKITMHTQKYIPHETMGMLVGHTKDNNFIISDVICLPINGDEKSVNASEEIDKMYTNELNFRQKTNFRENICGWFHSHPDLTCFMSSIDCATQNMHQLVVDPWLAIVIDPVQTRKMGTIQIGAYRTYPEGEKNMRLNDKIPRSQFIKKYGSTWYRYYELDIKFFKSHLDEEIMDLMWHDYWIMNLANCNLISGKENIDKKIFDMEEKFNEKKNELEKKGGNKTIEACKSVLEECKEIQNIFERGVDQLELKDILFNQKLND